MKKGDILVVIAVMLLYTAVAAVFLRPAPASAVAVIEIDGAVVRRIPLNSDETVDIHGVVLTIEGGTVRFVSSSCHDKTCVKTGRLSSPGRVAACVPNRVMVYVEDASETQTDVVLK